MVEEAQGGLLAVEVEVVEATLVEEVVIASSVEVVAASLELQVELL